jgi:diguanylate cyclase (GGDEF)-like protein/PAS domain S-box-containing protein
VVLDKQGRIKLANSAFEKLFQYQKDEFDSIDIARIGIPDSESTDSEQLIPRIFAGNAVHTKVRQQRRDGQVLDLALYGVPLFLNDEVCGAYLIYQDVSEETKAIEAQLEHAESLDLLVKELQLRTRQMTLLNEMGSFLECSGSVVDACAVVSMSMQKLFPEAHSGSLYLFKASRNVVETAARWGEAGVSEAMFLPDSCWSLRRGELHWTENPGSGITCGHLAASSDTQCLCVPMVAQGNTIGVLHLEVRGIAQLHGASGKEGSFRDGFERLAVSAASQIALSLASLQLREVLREQSIRDPLTHLFNRRFLEESLERELQLASRKKQELTVLFLDLDYFKKFNDAFGHGAGDMVLQSLADLFRVFFRSTDICCRYGGEEFAIVMPEASAQDAAIRANALRNEIKCLRLRYKNQPLGPISLSAGIATFPDHGSTAEELLRLADQSLYESKARGRDVVTVTSSQHA